MRKAILLISALAMSVGVAMPVSESKKIRDHLKRDPKRAGRLPRGRVGWPKTHFCHSRTPKTPEGIAAVASAEERRERRRLAREENRQRSIEGQQRALAKLTKAV